MNVAQLSNYYRSLAVFNARQEQIATPVSSTAATSAATSSTTSGTASGTQTTNGTASKEDTVEISAAATKANASATLTALEKSLRELNSLADLAGQSGVSSEFAAQLNTKATALAKALDSSLTDDSGKKFSELIDLSSPDKAKSSLATIAEGQKAIGDKRIELGLTPAASEPRKRATKLPSRPRPTKWPKPRASGRCSSTRP